MGADDEKAEQLSDSDIIRLAGNGMSFVVIGVASFFPSVYPASSGLNEGKATATNVARQLSKTAAGLRSDSIFL